MYQLKTYSKQSITYTFQMDQLQTDVRQKKHLLEKMTNAEAEHQVEIASLRENLTSVNNELSKLTEQVNFAMILKIGWSDILMWIKLWMKGCISCKLYLKSCINVHILTLILNERDLVNVTFQSV